MKPEIKKLLDEYLAAKKATSDAYDRLRTAAHAASKYSVGDKIKINDRVGIITHLKLNINDWMSDTKPTIDIEVIAYPIKKDGSIAKVGQMYVGYGDKVEIVEKAK